MVAVVVVLGVIGVTVAAGTVFGRVVVVVVVVVVVIRGGIVGIGVAVGGGVLAVLVKSPSSVCGTA